LKAPCSRHHDFLLLKSVIAVNGSQEVQVQPVNGMGLAETLIDTWKGQMRRSTTERFGSCWREGCIQIFHCGNHHRLVGIWGSVGVGSPCVVADAWDRARKWQ
jgi:hypothetical protein